MGAARTRVLVLELQEARLRDRAPDVRLIEYLLDKGADAGAFGTDLKHEANGDDEEEDDDNDDNDEDDDDEDEEEEDDLYEDYCSSDEQSPFEVVPYLRGAVARATSA